MSDEGKPKTALRERRDEQAAATRERLLRTAARFFTEHPGSALTLPKLARLAGVSPPTVYTHFGTVEKLMRSLYEWVLPQLGTRDPLPVPERLHEVPLERFPRFAKHGGLLRAIWTSGSWSGHRSKSRAPYVEAAIENLRRVAPTLSDQTLLLALGPVMSFSYPPMWQWLRDVVGLSEEEAELAAAWATRALVDALVSAPPVAVATKPVAKPAAPGTRRRSTRRGP